MPIIKSNSTSSFGYFTIGTPSTPGTPIGTPIGASGGNTSNNNPPSLSLGVAAVTNNKTEVRSLLPAFNDVANGDPKLDTQNKNKGVPKEFMNCLDLMYSLKGKSSTPIKEKTDVSCSENTLNAQNTQNTQNKGMPKRAANCSDFAQFLQDFSTITIKKNSNIDSPDSETKPPAKRARTE